MNTEFFISMVLIMLFAGLIFFSFQCSPNMENDPQYTNNICVKYGIVIVGYNCNGSITNMNGYPVLIRMAFVSGYRGESTRWTKELRPRQKISIHVGANDGYHIYRDGLYIGYLKPELNDGINDD